MGNSRPDIRKRLNAISGTTFHAQGQRKLAAVVGMFDGVHLGHRFLLDRLKEAACDRSLRPAVFTFPRHPLAVVNPPKAPGLLTDPAEKLSLLMEAGIAPEDINFMVFDSRLRSLSASEFLTMLHDRYNVGFILRGFNNRFGTERDLSPADYRRIAADCGIELEDADCFDDTSGARHSSDHNHVSVSSSSIRNALAAGDIYLANNLLGYPYQLSGIVGPGKQLGRTIGFPTANIQLPHSLKLIPANGVYICTADITAGRFRAMVNIGTRPTVDTNNRTVRSIEAHLLDFHDDLYGQTVTLRFHSRLRSEIRFPTIAALADQLAADRCQTANFPLPE